MKPPTRLNLTQACTFFRWFVAVFICQLLFTVALRAQPQPQLQLTAAIIQQSYCSIHAETSLQLRIKLRYTNLTPHRLIIYKGHDLFYQTKLRNQPAPDRQPYEVLLLNMRYFDEELERIETNSPGKVFVKLAPRESFERELTTGVGVAGKPEQRTSTSVAAGHHTLQLIVSTWYQSPKLAEKLRQQWSKEGVLWSQPVVSTPISVDIEEPTNLSPCRQADVR